MPDSAHYIDNSDSRVDEGPKNKAETGEQLAMLGALLPPLNVDAEAPQQSEKRLTTGTETDIFIGNLLNSFRPGDFGLTLNSYRYFTFVCCSRGQLVWANASLRLTRPVSLSIIGTRLSSISMSIDCL